MKKTITTVLCLSLVAFYSNAQKNLFDAADVDENGWIWFNTQEKIDKYIGQANNENAKYDENGKIIQLVSADFGDYEDSEASFEFAGAGTDGVLAGEGALTGAIRLAPASGTSATNGGGIIVKMPSCTSFNICVSADSKMYVRLLGTATAGTSTTDYQIASAKYTTVFKALSSAGIYNWLEMEQLTTGNEPEFKLASNKTMYAYFQSLTKYKLYIHGIKILTAEPTSVENPADDQEVLFDGKNILLKENAEISLFNVQGSLIKEISGSSMDLSGLTQGIYITKVAFGNQKSVTRKIAIR